MVEFKMLDDVPETFRLAEAWMWSEFADRRATYAAPLNAMAQWWRIPPAPWIGDRSVLRTRHTAMMPPSFVPPE